MRTSIPNPLSGGLVVARTANDLIATQEGATYRGRGHKTTRGVLPRLSSRTVSGTTHTHPLQVYLSGGYICVRAGHHIFWNSYSERIETMTYDGDEDEWVAGPGPTLLEKEAADAWIEPANASVIYVKRVFNSDGTATTTLEYAMPGLATPEDDYAAVINDVTNTEARWILAQVYSNVVTQWWTGGDIYELRVA